MTRRSVWFLGSIALALGITPSLGLADPPDIDRVVAVERSEGVTGAMASARPTTEDFYLPRARQPERLGSLPVDIRTTRPIADGCTFVQTVRGNIRVVRSRTGRHPGAVLYRPHLDVASLVQCPNRPVRVADRSHLGQGRVLTAADLETSIERRGATTVTRGAQACRYVPDYAFDGRQVAARSVIESCGVAFGGGPRRR
jgi:hypothetical protein